MPRSAAAALVAGGYDTQHVADIGLARAADAAILDQARQTGRVVVTLDADFHRLLAVSGASLPSVVRIRREGLRGMEVARWIERVIARVGRQIEQGAVVTINERGLRVRRLPIR